MTAEKFLSAYLCRVGQVRATLFLTGLHDVLSATGLNTV